MLALMDGGNSQRVLLLSALRADPDGWVIPWAVLPELDYMVARRLGQATVAAFRADLAEGRLPIEWGGCSRPAQGPGA